MAFEGASFLLQWAAGGLLFLWVTTRRREVSLGYGWLMRGTYGIFALGAAAVGFFVIDTVWVRDLASLFTALAAFVTLGVSVVRRKAGVRQASGAGRSPVGAGGGDDRDRSGRLRRRTRPAPSSRLRWT